MSAKAAQRVGRSGKALSPRAASCGDWQRIITKSCWLWRTAEAVARVWLWSLKARKIVSTEALWLGESRPHGQSGRRIWIGGFAVSSLREESPYPTKENSHTDRAAEGHSSYVVTDPKGDIVIDCGQALLKNGYSIRLWNDLIILVNKYDCSGCGPDLIGESLLNK